MGLAPTENREVNQNQFRRRELGIFLIEKNRYSHFLKQDTVVYARQCEKHK